MLLFLFCQIRFGLYHELQRPGEVLWNSVGFLTGLATFHVQHTSASLLIQENADPEVRRDL
ncbi:MAG: YjbQ family protein, partial [Bacteroidetes bacterium]|nr:YjbQ family protein [Bacteroidota bacterium]